MPWLLLLEPSRGPPCRGGDAPRTRSGSDLAIARNGAQGHVTPGSSVLESGLWMNRSTSLMVLWRSFVCSCSRAARVGARGVRSAPIERRTPTGSARSSGSPIARRLIPLGPPPPRERAFLAVLLPVARNTGRHARACQSSAHLDCNRAELESRAMSRITRAGRARS
jgi:hypothetical protein